MSLEEMACHGTYPDTAEEADLYGGGRNDDSTDA